VTIEKLRSQEAEDAEQARRAHFDPSRLLGCLNSCRDEGNRGDDPEPGDWKE
jgi:hypothetical protein